MTTTKLINTTVWQPGTSGSMDGTYYAEGVATDGRPVVVRHAITGVEMEAWIGEGDDEEHYTKAKNGWSRDWEHTPGI